MAYELLLNFNGADGSTTLTDESSNNYSPVQNVGAELDDAWYKWGGTSLKLGQVYWTLSTPLETAWTVHQWMNFGSTTGYYWFALWGDDNISGAGVGLQLLGDGYATLYVIDDSLNNTTLPVSATGEVHVAITYDGTNVKIYFNGVEVLSVTCTLSGIHTVYLADLGSAAPVWVDSLGVAREVLWTSNFVPSSIEPSDDDEEGARIGIQMSGTISTTIPDVLITIWFYPQLSNATYREVSASMPISISLTGTMYYSSAMAITGDSLLTWTGSAYGGACVDADVCFDFSATATTHEVLNIDADVYFEFDSTATTTQLTDISADILFDFSATATTALIINISDCDVFFEFESTATVANVFDLDCDFYFSFDSDISQAPTSISIDASIYFDFIAFARVQSSYDCLVLNVQNQALSTFTNYSFNSFATFKGLRFAAKSTGIFLLSGNDDAGTEIAVEIDTHKLDLEAGRFVRPKYAWLAMKSDGGIRLTIRDERMGDEYEYHVDSMIDDTYGGYKVKIGKGIKSRYITLKIKNYKGSSLYLDKLRLFGEQIARPR